jgi:hypothetical protein
MPLYFSEVAPTCPISTDSTSGPGKRFEKTRNLFNRVIFNQATIPSVAHGDLQSAIRVANIARSIVTSVTKSQVRNNVYSPKGGGRVSIGKDKFKNKAARWVEQKDKRVKNRYKYFGTDIYGNENLLTYVTVERIERMVWYDRAWKSYLTWEYGDGGGEPVGKDGKTARERAMEEPA